MAGSPPLCGVGSSSALAPEAGLGFLEEAGSFPRGVSWSCALSYGRVGSLVLSPLYEQRSLWLRGKLRGPNSQWRDPPHQEISGLRNPTTGLAQTSQLYFWHPRPPRRFSSRAARLSNRRELLRPRGDLDVCRCPSSRGGGTRTSAQDIQVGDIPKPSCRPSSQCQLFSRDFWGAQGLAGVGDAAGCQLCVGIKALLSPCG